MGHAVLHKGGCLALSTKISRKLNNLRLNDWLYWSVFFSPFFFFSLYHSPSLHHVWLSFSLCWVAIIHSTGNALSLWPHGIEGPSQTVYLSEYALLTIQKHLLSVFSWNISSQSLNRVPVLSSHSALDLNDEFCGSGAESGLDPVSLRLGFKWWVSDLNHKKIDCDLIP